MEYGAYTHKHAQEHRERQHIQAVGRDTVDLLQPVLSPSLLFVCSTFYNVFKNVMLIY